ncbi:MAG: gamma-glutamylcyclotransferase [Proteobacteria bacterium]|nr:gamma-glutamylcyclotransferase [Pseudomonadota bacterium]
MRDLIYLAYGSNLHPVRMTERVPSAELIGVVKLVGYHLMFHKRGMDHSGKCNLQEGVPHAYGALFKMSAAHKPALDSFEGKGCGYDEICLEVSFQGTRRECFSYIANPAYRDDRLRPFHWYKRLVILGAEHHCLPGDYVDEMEAVESVADSDGERRGKHEQLIEKMLNYP